MSIQKSFTLPLFFAAFYLVWALRATLIYSTIDASIPEEGTRLLFSNALKFLLWVLPAVIYIRWVDRRSPVDVMRLRSGNRAADFLHAGVVALSYFGIVFLVEALVNHRTLSPLLQSSVPRIFETLTAVLISPFIEELTFRGFVLPMLQERLSFWLANVLQSFLFTAMHLPFWIWQNGLHVDLFVTSLGVFALGLLLGWVTSKTNSIWPAIGVHVLNNFLTAFLG